MIFNSISADINEVKKVKISTGEIFFYIFFAVLLGAKGIGWYDGMLQFKVALVISCLFFIAKILTTEHSIVEYLFIIAILLLGSISYITSGDKGLLLCVMLIAGMKEIPVNRIFKVGLVVFGGTFIWRLFFLFTGINKGNFFVHEKMGLGHLFRWTAGYAHPNVFHISYVILIAFIFYIFKFQKKKLVIATIVAFVGNILIFVYSLSFTGFLLTCIYLILENYFSFRENLGLAEKIVINLVFPGCILFSIFMPLIPEGKLFDFLNNLLNTRLNLSRIFLTSYDISFWGQKIVTNSSSINIDNSFLYALMFYGMVPFLILCILYILTIRDLVIKEKKQELAIVVGFLIAGISEPFLFNTSFKNITLIFVGNYVFTYLDQVGGKKFSLFNTKMTNIKIPIKLGINLYESFQKNCKQNILIAAAIGVVAAVSCAVIEERPNSYIVPVNLCDYSNQERIVINKNQVDNLQNSGRIVLGYAGEDVEMYEFSGNIVQVEYMREILGIGIIGISLGYIVAGSLRYMIIKK